LYTFISFIKSIHSLMSFFEYLPHEYSYACYLAYIYDFSPYDSMIFNMVSERYPREEDEDDGSVDDSDEDAVSVEDSAAIAISGEDSDEVAIFVQDSDEVAVSDEDSSEIPAEFDSSDFVTVHDSDLIFGSFGQASDAVPVSPITLITPLIEGKSFKIGEIGCVLSDSEFVTVEEQQSSNLSSPSPIKCQHGNGVDQFLHRLKIKKSVQLAVMVIQSSVITSACTTTAKVKLRSDFSATCLSCSDFVFDPGGAFSLIPVCVVLKVFHHTRSRLWWIPWDRGRHKRVSNQNEIKKSAFFIIVFGKSCFGPKSLFHTFGKSCFGPQWLQLCVLKNWRVLLHNLSFLNHGWKYSVWNCVWVKCVGSNGFVIFA
jgi:hypothetical protein